MFLLEPEASKVLCQPHDAVVDFVWRTALGENRAGALPWAALARCGPSLALLGMRVALSPRCRSEHLSAAWHYSAWISRRWGSPKTWTRPSSDKELSDQILAVPPLPDMVPDPDSPLSSAPRAASRSRTPPRRDKFDSGIEVSPATVAHWVEMGPRSPMHHADSPTSIRCKSFS